LFQRFRRQEAKPPHHGNDNDGEDEQDHG
jgi:hypothetical protein